MKSFKSSISLKPIETNAKEQNILRSRIKLLQEQVQRLQQSNLNIYIPISQHTLDNNIDYKSLIAKLKAQVLSLQHQTQLHKNTIKKLDKEKQNLILTHKKEINQLKHSIQILQQNNQQLQQQINDAYQQLNSYKQQCSKMQKQLIEKTVEIKFLNQDLQEVKKHVILYQQKHEDILKQISAVQNSHKVYKSYQLKITAIQTSELKKLYSRIQQLERKLREIEEASKLEKITLGIPKKNIGQQIVRLKKNLDIQLGLQSSSAHSQSFLNIYNQTNNLFKKLIEDCKK